VTETSTPIRHDPTGRVWCRYGDIARTWVSGDTPGVITNMGPLILVRRDHAAESANLRHFGVQFTVTNGVAKTEARNGVWIHRLQPAHWADGPPPGDLWVPEILLGRWPD
jgi:hypothetical protein